MRELDLQVSFPGVSIVKNPPAKAGDAGPIPGLGRSPAEGNGNPLQWEIPKSEEPGRLQSMGLIAKSLSDRTTTTKVFKYELGQNLKN